MKTLSIFLLLLIASGADAQSHQKHAVYAAGGFSVGNYAGGGISIIYQYREHFSFQIDNIGLRRRFAEFSAPHFGDADLPLKNINAYGFLVGYFLVYNPVKHYRIGVKAGGIYSKTRTPYNVQYIPGGAFLFIFHKAAYYDYDIRETENWGISMEISLELPTRKNFGFAIGAYLYTDKSMAAFGFKGSMLLGRLYHLPLNVTSTKSLPSNSFSKSVR